MAGGTGFHFDPTGLALQPTATVLDRGANPTVTDSSETLVKSHTVTGSKLYLDGIALHGDWPAEFRVYVNTILKQTKRTSFVELSPELPFSGVPLQVGDVLEVRVVHYDVGNTHSYEATVKGHR